jgi:hypothetical protein
MHFARSYCAILACVATLVLAGSAAGIASTTITFESNQLATPPAADNYSNSFSAANGGSDTVNGITFDDNFLVVGSNYSLGLGGTDPYAIPIGQYAIVNSTDLSTVGMDGLVITTNQTLQSAYFGQNDYGNGSFGADQVTVTAFGASGDLASAMLDLTSPTLSLLDTSSIFNPFAGQITGYRINREVSPDYATLGQGGGNYIADNFTFTPSPSAVPEPGSLAIFGVFGLLTGYSLVVVRRRQIA